MTNRLPLLDRQRCPGQSLPRGRHHGSLTAISACKALRMVAWALTVITAVFSATSVGAAGAESTTAAPLQKAYVDTVTPFLNKFCLDCHGAELQEAKLDLSLFTSVDQVIEGHQTWEILLERLEAGEMPPEDAEQQPEPAARRAVIDWIRTVRKYAANRDAGDPGSVLARRLSNAEYNYTIRDLTGADIRPTHTFPVDPANEAGFDNSGESLAMSPALLKKYLEAARLVAEHLVLKPEGFTFAPHPAVTDTDRDKYCVKRIVQFYQRQPTDLADYFLAAWRFQYRADLGKADATLAETARANNVSSKYLALVWSTLTEAPEDGEPTTVGPIARLQSMWRELPTDPTMAEAAQAGCVQMRDYVVTLRRRLEPQFPNLYIKGNHRGSQTFVLWKNRQYAAHRRSFDRDALKVAGEPAAENETLEDLIVPADETERARYEKSFERFCDVFPDAFYISERGRDYVDKPRDQQEKGRLLSAGFHSMMGYFRDDAPLYDMVLTADQQQELDGLWQELDFVTSAPMRQYTGFVWFERTDSRYMRDPVFDFARAEDKNVTSAAMIERLAEVYLAKARRNGGEDVALQAIEDYFTNIDAQIRWVEQARLAAEPSHLETLLDFAERAYRRRLSKAERDDLRAFYHSLREVDELSHEEAIQDCLVSVLMSPHFCYRVDLVGGGGGSRALSNDELASRLSYFLWSSLPDRELLEEAAAGRLTQRDVLLTQVRRMLRDDRVRGLATEFAGNWLDFRRFEEHNAVDRERFPQFTDELRQAMFEEPLRFFLDVAQHDRSILEFLDADHTFVNSVLAQHYGLTDVTVGPDEWTRVDDLGESGRGGLLPMGVFLTKNAPGLRTSPVKRGYWVVRRLLGERIPPPPPNVPELPNDERSLGDLTLGEVLARHREHKSCAVCHDRFDSIGLVFEGFGPVGERRETDLGGRPVDLAAEFPDGSRRDGVDGLREYLREHRQNDFVENVCRKLLSYALGRTLLLSDDPLIDTMQSRLAADDYRFGSLVETIVTSRQFLEKRGRDSLAKE